MTPEEQQREIEELFGTVPASRTVGEDDGDPTPVAAVSALAAVKAALARAPIDDEPTTADDLAAIAQARAEFAAVVPPDAPKNDPNLPPPEGKKRGRPKKTETATPAPAQAELTATTPPAVTKVDTSDWMYSVQEQICKAIEAEGVALVKPAPSPLDAMRSPEWQRESGLDAIKIARMLRACAEILEEK